MRARVVMEDKTEQTKNLVVIPHFGVIETTQATNGLDM